MAFKSNICSRMKAGNEAAEQVLLAPARPEILIPSRSTGRDLGSMVPSFIPDVQQPLTSGTSLYLYYDVNDMLIYVGITGRGIARNREHNARAEFWPFVARQEVEHLGGRAEAATRERELIRLYHPPFNKQHNPYYAEVRAEYLALVASTPVEPAALARSLNRRLPLRVIEQDGTRLVLSTYLEHFAVVRRVERSGEDELIFVAGHSARVARTYRHGGHLVVRVKSRTPLFPKIHDGHLGIKFKSQNPVTFRIATVHVNSAQAA